MTKLKEETDNWLRNPMTYWPVGLWVMFALLMLYSAVVDPSAPAGADAHGQNGPHSLLLGVGISFVELVIFMVLFVPGAARRSWWRWFSVSALLLPWTAALTFFVQHAGSVHLMHVAWLFSLLCLVVASAAYRVLRAVRNFA